MPPEIPIACTLGATEARARLAELAAIGRAALLGTTTAGRRATLRFRPRTRVRERLEAIVAAEADCCGFLDLSLSDAPGAVMLHIAAPPGAEGAVADVVAAFAAGGTAA